MIEFFTLAIAGAPFGLKGHIKVKSLSGEVGHLVSLKSVCLRQDDSEKLFNIEEITPFGSGSAQEGSGEFLLIKFEGIDSPEAAKALAGAELIGDRSQAAPLKNNEFYIEDLKGLEVIAASDGTVLGHITNVLEGGGGELAEIKLLSCETKLVPFRNEFFGDISLEKRQVVLLEQWILE